LEELKGKPIVVMLLARSNVMMQGRNNLGRARGDFWAVSYQVDIDLKNAEREMSQHRALQLLISVSSSNRSLQ
jgi:hypothetical protein